MLKNNNGINKIMLGSKTQQEYQAYVSQLKFEVFDIIKELDDKRNFAMSITSKRRTGKSILLKHFCSLIKNWYVNCYVFSMSAHLQPGLFDFVKKENIIEGFNEKKLLEIWKAQEVIATKLKAQGAEMKDIPKTLILFDDIIGDEKVRHSPTLNNFFILGRHLGFAQIIITQSMGGKYGLPAVVRSNLDVACAFFLDAEYCRKLFCEQYLSAKDRKLGSIIFDRITREKPYQAIVCLNCKISKEITDCVKTFIADEKVRKFTIGELTLKKMKNTSIFTQNIPVSSGLLGVDFMPRISSKKNIMV